MSEKSDAPIFKSALERIIYEVQQSEGEAAIAMQPLVPEAVLEAAPAENPSVPPAPAPAPSHFDGNPLFRPQGV